MPVYEYKCSGCGESFALLVLSRSMAESAACPGCGSKDIKKRPSAFSSYLNAGASGSSFGGYGGYGGG